MSRPASEGTRVAVFVPADLASRTLGGIQTFVRGFVKFAPRDVPVEVIGATSDAGERPIGRWQALHVGERSVPYLPVARVPAGAQRARVPVALRYTAALLRHAHRIPTKRRVLQFHRAGTPLAIVGRSISAIQVVHLNVADIYAEAGESRWRSVPGLYQRVEDVTLGRMARVFFVNRAGLDLYAARYPRLADRFEFMTTWFDHTQFRPPTSGERDRVRHELCTELGWPASAAAEPLILFVGRLEAQKNPALVIDAFAAHRATAGRGRLLLVGDGTLREDARRQVEASGLTDVVRLIGAQQPHNVARLMRAADALLLASLFEGMPITVLEALGSGLPVVSTAVGEVPRVVTSGVSGWLASDQSAKELARGLAWVIEQEPSELTANVLRASEPYSADRVLEPFYAAHREVWHAHWSAVTNSG